MDDLQLPRPLRSGHPGPQVAGRPAPPRDGHQWRVNFSRVEWQHEIQAGKYQKVPNTREALESLPGVGRKTANVILNTAFGQPTIAVDTHIFRLGNRIGLAPGKTPLEVEMKLMKAVPQAFIQDAHHLLILHGRYTCVARQPKCGDCVIRDLCEYKAKAA